jgi:subtilisin family serine protease
MRQHRVGTLLFCALLASACKEELVDPLGGAGVGPTGGGGAEAGGGDMGGSGGDPLPPDRGDPATFPTTCVATCEEACAALVGCGSEASPVHPVGLEECLQRCSIAVDGPFWDDVSGVFRCCASQPECSDVAHCGGWLDHPTATAACSELCECFTSDSIASLTGNHAAPTGYAFAPDALYVVAHDAAASDALRATPGVVAVEPGKYQLVKLGTGERPDTLSRLLQAGNPLPTFTDRSGRLSAASGRIVLRARSAAELTAATADLARFGLKAPRKLAFSVDLHLVESTDAWVSLDALAALTARGVVAELDMMRSYSSRFLPNDPLYEDQWHLKNAAQGLSTATVDARVEEAWDYTRGDPSVIIAINDDGVDLNQFDFAGKLAPELNFPPDWEEQMANNAFGGHGTACAGVAAARGNNLFAGSGACSDCTVLPHLLGPSAGGGSFQVTEVEIAKGFEQQVDAGAWVISNSWGASTGDPVYADDDMPVANMSLVVSAAFDYAETSGRGGLGTVIVFAAGNSNATIDGLSSYPTNVVVGAVSDLGLKSYYSSFGPELDIAAPSNGGLTGITTTAANGGTTSAFGGTSSACPLVSGVVGLILAANPALTAAQARGILTGTAAKIDPLFGQYDVSGVSPFYGHGMVDAARAVRLAAGLCADAASCRTPSDECGAACGTKGQCDTCRTGADCTSGSICQALPSLGALVCVEQAIAGSCPTGTSEVHGFCVPDPATCGLCAPSETCNGRDDDCNGAVDENDVCEGSARCFFEGPGCGSGLTCAGTVCASTCSGDTDCDEGQTCRPVKDGYGAASGASVCASSPANGCELGCEVIASTLEDGPLAEFVTCMDEADSNCNEVFGCSSLLPIEM